MILFMVEAEIISGNRGEKNTMIILVSILEIEDKIIGKQITTAPEIYVLLH